MMQIQQLTWRERLKFFLTVDWRLIDWFGSAKVFGLFFAVQFISYANLSWNYRAIAQGRYTHIVITDALASFLGWTVIKKVGEATSRFGLVGYMIGGSVGSCVAVYVSKKVFGE